MAHALEGRVRQVAIITLPGCAATGGWRRLEMERKRCDYFAGGTSLGREVNSERRRVPVPFFSAKNKGAPSLCPALFFPVPVPFSSPCNSFPMEPL